MGILNVTPDSFSDGGKFLEREKAVEQALQMEEDGADLIDIGGESTRPGAKPVPIEFEIKRVIPVIKAIAKKIKVVISVDTRKAKVAEMALVEGADIVNDVSALRFDPAMASLIAKEGVPVVLMHMKGTPEHMQDNICYREIVSEIMEFFKERISFARQMGIEENKIIIDPGIGFGKSIEKDNFTILKNLAKFTELEKPIMVGPSRKAFLGHLLNLPVDDREEATAAAVAVAIMNGANIVRVHDVKKMKRVAQVVDAIRRAY
ncbi:MAG: dihydropteroate synthase [Desulfobacterota bacterium]|nr:dihydropteroate synthase [Thermodesulfobacteriota bacterium]